MTRRTRRRAYVVALAALIGAGSPAWGPPLLRTLPAFRVESVEVTGTRYLAPDEVLELADVPPEASVWDDPGRWRRRVEAHPLVARARVRRSGFHALEISVEEVEPVALAATPGLRPVSAGGVVLPLDASAHDLDLPVLHAEVRAGVGERLRNSSARTLVRVLARLRREKPGFVGEISSLRRLRGGGIEARMVEGTHARVVLLPPRNPVRALRRAELALGEQEGSVATADARFRDQVLLRPGGEEQ